jgi:hypothetical protein
MTPAVRPYKKCHLEPRAKSTAAASLYFLIQTYLHKFRCNPVAFEAAGCCFYINVEL